MAVLTRRTANSKRPARERFVLHELDPYDSNDDDEYNDMNYNDDDSENEEFEEEEFEEDQETKSELVEELDEEKQTMNWKIKLIKFTFFAMYITIYWGPKQIINVCANLFTKIVSNELVTPILDIWSASTNNANCIPGIERRRQIASCCSLILFIVLSATFITATFDNPNFYSQLFQKISVYQPTRHTQNNLESSLSSYLSNINKKDKVANSNEPFSDYYKTGDNLWTKTERTKMLSEIYSLQSSEFDARQSKLESAIQLQFEFIKKSLNQSIQSSIESHLPQILLAYKNQSGGDGLKLSSQLFNSLQDSAIWNKKVLKECEESLENYFAQEGFTITDDDGGNGPFIIQLLPDMINAIVVKNMKELIDSEIIKYHNDVLNTADYALKSRGARILHSMTSSTYSPIPAWSQAIGYFITGLRVKNYNPPEMAISSQTNAGKCWRMHGNEGSLGIGLSEPVIIQGFTVEYPSSEIMANQMDSAPKEIELFGVILPSSLIQSSKLVPFGVFQYDINNSSGIQTFNIENYDVFDAVHIKVNSNWGNLNHTDIYRIRIHGRPL